MWEPRWRQEKRTEQLTFFRGVGVEHECRQPKLRCRTISDERHSACCYKVQSTSVLHTAWWNRAVKFRCWRAEKRKKGWEVKVDGDDVIHARQMCESSRSIASANQNPDYLWPWQAGSFYPMLPFCKSHTFKCCSLSRLTKAVWGFATVLLPTQFSKLTTLSLSFTSTLLHPVSQLSSQKYKYQYTEIT